MNSTALLLSRLSDWGGTILKPPSSEELEHAQCRLGCSFPQGIFEFYSQCNGLSRPTDEGIWDFYSLDRLKIASNDPNEILNIEPFINIYQCNLILFCDALIEATTYGFYADSSSPHFGRFYSHEPDTPWEAGSSYDGFVQAFLTQDSILIGLQ